jgi:hypothetical protein
LLSLETLSSSDGGGGLVPKRPRLTILVSAETTKFCILFNYFNDTTVRLVILALLVLGPIVLFLILLVLLLLGFGFTAAFVSMHLVRAM